MKLADTLSELKDEIIEYKKQLKEYQVQDKDKKRSDNKESKLNKLSSAIHPTENGHDTAITTDGQKLLNAGWTIAKVSFS